MQPVKPIKPLYYPCIICSNINHQFGDYLKKTKVHNIIQVKLFNTTTITPKPLKTNNVFVNVIVDITTCSKTLEQ